MLREKVVCFIVDTTKLVLLRTVFNYVLVEKVINNSGIWQDLLSYNTELI